MRRTLGMLCLALSLLLTGLCACAEESAPPSPLEVTREFSSPYAAYGDQITLSYTVRNTSKQAVAGVVLSDPLVGEVGRLARLGPGESKTILAHTVVTDDTLSAPEARCTLNGAETVAFAAAESIRIERAALSAELSLRTGEEEALVLTVTNEGGVPLFGVKAADGVLGDMGPAEARLDPGESAAFIRAARAGRFQCAVTAATAAGKSVSARSNELEVAGGSEAGGGLSLSAEADADGRLILTLTNPGPAMLRDVTLRAGETARHILFVPVGNGTQVAWPAAAEGGAETVFEALDESGAVLARTAALLPAGEAAEPDDALPQGPSFRVSDAARTYRLMLAGAIAALAVILIVWQLSSQRRKWLERRARQRQRQESHRRQLRKNGEKTA